MGDAMSKAWVVKAAKQPRFNLRREKPRCLRAI